MPDGLAASVSARTADFQTGMRAARESLGDVATSAGSAALALGRAEEGMDSTRNSAITMATAVGSAGVSFNVLSTSATGSIATLTTLGAVATGLATTLVPLTATLGGLATAAGAVAAAFGAVAGSGALAYGKQLNEQYQDELLAVRDQIEEYEQLQETRGQLTDQQREQLRQLKQEEQRLDDAEGALSALQIRLGEVGSELSSIIADWGQGFAPLIRDAINAIPDLTRNILEAIGSMDQFAGALRSFGREAMTLIPAIAGELATLAREALPVVVDGMRWFRNNGGSIFDSILATTRRVAPMLQDVGGAFVDALPSINRFGIAILDQALPAIESGVRGFGSLLDEIMAFTQTQQFERIMQALRQSATELQPELEALRQNLGDMIQTVIENAPAMIRGITAVADSVLDIVNALTPILTGFIELVAAASEAWADWTERSEQQEQNLARQGLTDYVTSGTLDMLQNSRPQSMRSRTRDELRIVVDSNDEKFDAKIDERIYRDSRESFDALDRGAYRGE